MAINQISSANTFEQWLIATQQLISFANSITDSGGTFTSNTSEYVITGNLSVGNTVTAPTVNTDVIIFDDGTRLSSNVQIVNGYAHSNGAFNHANGAFNKANAANVLAQAAYDYANTISLSGEIAGDNVIVLYTVTGNNIVANVLVTTANITVTSNVTTSNITASNNVTVTKNVSAGNVVVTNKISAADVDVTNNISSANITVSNNVSTGNISVTNDLNTTNITSTNITATLITATDVNTTSDTTLKYNMQQILNPMEVLEKLTGFEFNWKSDGLKSYGLSAQDVEKVLPEIVRTRNDGLKGINYLNLIAFLIEAIKELKKEMAEVKNGINKQ